MYAEGCGDVSKMIGGLNHNSTKECRDFAESINYQMIASGLKSCNAKCNENNIKQKVKKFFQGSIIHL